MIYHSEVVNKATLIKQLGGIFLNGASSTLDETYAKSWASAAEIRSSMPSASTDALCQRARNKYLTQVSLVGAASGAIAAAPFLGTLSTLGSTAGDLYYFGRASVNHVLLLAALHDLELTDPQLRRLTVLSSLLNEPLSTANIVESKSFIENMNQKLAERVVIKVGTKLLPIRAGAALPLLVGAATAASLNAKLAKQLSVNSFNVIRLQAI